MDSRASRAVLYLRQSTYREESISLELQETACREYAQRRGYSVVGVESDPGLSGRTFNRPGVAAVMDKVDRGDADVIVLWKWSRLSRNRLDWYQAADRAQQAGGRIESATEPIDTSTSIGRLSRGMMIEIAAFESERAGDQWKEAQERRIRNGLPHDGRNRFGYVYDADAKMHRPDPATGPVLVELYERYVGGAAFSALVTWLAAQGIPPHSAQQWSIASVKRTLDTGFAAGLITYRGEKHPGAHQALIDESTWAAYLEARARRRQRPRAERSQYLLSGIVRCATCGLAMTGWTHTSRPYTYYRCERAVHTRIHFFHDMGS
jgi:DNA invertase Pin-like site-specific DNA recombinase